jgi:hypothetical protein
MIEPSASSVRVLMVRPLPMVKKPVPAPPKVVSTAPERKYRPTN